MEFPSWVRLTSGKNLFPYFLPYVELSLDYLFLNAREISCRPGHVPWRSVSSHLMVHIVSVCKALSLIHIQIFVKLDPDEGWEWLNLSARRIRCCKLRAIKSPTKQLSLKPLWSKCLREATGHRSRPTFGFHLFYSMGRWNCIIPVIWKRERVWKQLRSPIFK